MRTGCRDRVVADGVAVAAGALMEDALDDALAARVLDDAGELADDVLEALRGDLDGEPQLGELVLVLHQPQLRDEAGEVVVLADHEVVVVRLEVVDVRCLDPELSRHAREGRARADPELADRGIRVELARRAVGPLAEEEGDVVPAVFARIEDEHGVGLRSPTPSP